MDEAIAARDSALDSIAEKLVTARVRIEAGEAEIGRHRARVEELERVAARLAERVVERERELRRVREELERGRAGGGEGTEALAALAGEIDALRRQARRQATRIRLSALREAADVGERVKEIAGGTGGPALEALAAALDRVGADEDVEFAPALGAPRPRRAGELVEGAVEIDIGPLGDFSQLVGFEDAAQSIAAVSELSIRRFSEGRATLTVSLKEPVPLLAELRERCALVLELRAREANRLVLDVVTGSAAAAA